MLNAAGKVTLSGGPMLNVTVPIQADGTYTFLDVLAGNYIVTATVTNTLLTGVTNSVAATGQTTTTNIDIISAGVVTGLVTRPDNSLAIGDTVNLRITGFTPLTTSVDTSGHYSFTDVPIGPAEVDCYDSLSNTAGTANFTIMNGVTTTANLPLQSAGTVNGTISVNDGSSVAGLTVTLTSSTSTGTQTLTTTANGLGVFTFTNVTPGTIVLRSTNSEGLQGTGNGSLPIAGSTVTINISLIAAGNLQGTVFLGDGTTPAPGIQVTLSPAPLTGTAVVTTGSNGQFSYANVPVGNFSLNASNTTNGDQGSANGQIQTINQQRTVNIRLNGFGNLAVTVLNPSGAPVPDASVTVTTNNIYSKKTASTNSSGVAQFSNIFAGSFNVSASDPVSGYSVNSGGTIAYNGNATITLNLQALASLQGTIYAPDGVTPEGGATVVLIGPVNKNVVTGSNGTYSFASIPTGYYDISVRDAAVVTRAYVNGIQLQTSGSVITQNLTFVGVGSVSGTVTNQDGSPAQNFAITLTSQNSIIGGAQGVTTASDGTYIFAEVPVGKFTMAVNNLPVGEIGYGNGSITADGGSATVNIQIQGNSITLPVTLTDADGFTFAIYGNGTYSGNGSSGGLNPFYGTQALNISVAGAYTGFGNSGAAAIQSLNGQQVELSAPVGSLNVTRKIYVPANGYFARRLDVLQNPTSSPITATVLVGSGGYNRVVKNGAISVITSSNGTTNLTASTNWVVDDDDTGAKPYPQTQPALANVYSGPSAPTGLASLSYSSQTYTYGYGGNGSNLYTLTYGSVISTYVPVVIPANSQVSFLTFTSQEATDGTAETAAQRLTQLPPEALAGLSTTDIASIVNFVVPSTSNLPAINPPVPGTLGGQVVAGDNVTPVPNAAVYVQSTDLEYGSGATATADASGNYSLPFAATSYAAEAIDPITSQQSVMATGAFQAGSLTQTQNIPFTNTGILQGLIQTTGQTKIFNGSAYASSYCGNMYCGQASRAFGPTGTFTFLTLPSGSANVYANVYTSAAGGFYLTGGQSISPGVTNYITLTLPATGNVSGVVTNADGTPATERLRLRRSFNHRHVRNRHYGCRWQLLLHRHRSRHVHHQCDRSHHHHRRLEDRSHHAGHHQHRQPAVCRQRAR